MASMPSLEPTGLPLETVIDPDGGVTTYSYSAVGALVHTELPNGTAETRAYDELNRLVLHPLQHQLEAGTQVAA